MKGKNKNKAKKKKPQKTSRKNFRTFGLKKTWKHKIGAAKKSTVGKKKTVKKTEKDKSADTKNGKISIEKRSQNLEKIAPKILKKNCLKKKLTEFRFLKKKGKFFSNQKITEFFFVSNLQVPTPHCCAQVTRHAHLEQQMRQFFDLQRVEQLTNHETARSEIRKNNASQKPKERLKLVVFCFFLKFCLGFFCFKFFLKKACWAGKQSRQQTCSHKQIAEKKTQKTPKKKNPRKNQSFRKTEKKTSFGFFFFFFVRFFFSADFDELSDSFDCRRKNSLRISTHKRRRKNAFQRLKQQNTFSNRLVTQKCHKVNQHCRQATPALRFGVWKTATHFCCCALD